MGKVGWTASDEQISVDNLFFLTFSMFYIKIWAIHQNSIFELSENQTIDFGEL